MAGLWIIAKAGLFTMLPFSEQASVQGMRVVLASTLVDLHLIEARRIGALAALQVILAAGIFAAGRIGILE
ncbi:hypothetical protein HK105_205722 [Polyrhizophydium stewartii]|uniref:Uncharacterized protein n=1 Tax=Polyrhizophydium stewartii TaxID=2732419 RepID=A0ABR4N5P4_9FUNG